MSARFSRHFAGHDAPPTPSERQALARGWERIAERRSRRGARAWLFVPVVAALAVIVLLVVVRPWGSAPVAHVPVVTSPAVAPLAITTGGALPERFAASAVEPVVVGFDDRSRVEIAAGASLRTLRSEPKDVALALDHGKATLDITPGGPRRWSVDAGDVVVRVLGTRFSVDRSGGHVKVAVERGKVRVESAKLAGGHVVLGAGESTDVPEAVETLPATPAEALPAAPPVPTSKERVAPLEKKVEAASDALAAADDARRAGRARDAAAILETAFTSKERDRARAPLVAFTLGKLHADDLGDPTTAARWFTRALDLGLAAPLDEDALARLVECHVRAARRAEALEAVSRYRAAFPNGRHRARVDGLVRDSAL